MAPTGKALGISKAPAEALLGRDLPLKLELLDHQLPVATLRRGASQLLLLLHPGADGLAS